jgi:RNA polymerase sigma factor (sigma-70 family)
MLPYLKTALEPQALTDRGRATRERLDELARRYYAPLLSFFRSRTHNNSEVQDLVQQVFLRLAQHQELGRIQCPDAYIFQTASNILKDRYRQADVRRRFSDHGRIENADTPDTDFSPERVLLGRETIKILAGSIRQLPERTRDILMLRCLEGQQYVEIARLQNISVRAVEKHMARALAHLSQALERMSR